MKKVLLIYVILIAGIVTWYYAVGKEKRIFENSKGSALKVSKHSNEFNQTIEKAMDDYYKMVDNFSQGDTSTINKNAAVLKESLENLKMDELKMDSDIYETAASIWENTKTEISGMQSDPSFQAKKESLNLFSNELFTLLLTIRYDLAKLYWQECGNAFGEDTPGNWISKEERAPNPYGVKDCAAVKKVINFAPADSTKK